jgi:8-oxo-dGTP pyrophosphatase MutT (NUDIX family)
MNDLASPGAAEMPEVEVRPAATVMLVRDGWGVGEGEPELEVLMLLRHSLSVFAAGAWVFPGGAVDEADDGVAAIWAGPTDAEASAILGLPSGGLAYWVAAARECFEEAGILLARDTVSGAWVETAGELAAARFARHRRDVHAGRTSLAGVLAAEGLMLDLGAVLYASHWVTPPGGVRRFDTRFFVAPAPPGQTASHDTRETVESVWTTPARALERHAAGEIHLVFPTIKNLEALACFGTTAELLEAARLRRPSSPPSTPASDPEPPCPT